MNTESLESKDGGEPQESAKVAKTSVEVQAEIESRIAAESGRRG